MMPRNNKRRRGDPVGCPCDSASAAPRAAGTPRPRRRGGQPGNRNAVRHGFYTSIFRSKERSLLQHIPLTDLSAEIDLIRITNRRFLRALKASQGDLDLQTQLTALRAVNLSAHSIATLLRAHALTAALSEEGAAALSGLDGPTPEDDASDADA